MNRLQETRMLLGLTQPQVSAKLKSVEPRADVGMVSRYEKGVCLPTKDQLAALEDLDLLGLPAVESEPTEESEKADKAPPPSHAGRFRKCYRISREFAASLPDDLLQVCGYSSWQSWHDAALKRLLAEYAARSRGIKKKEDKTA